MAAPTPYVATSAWTDQALPGIGSRALLAGSPGARVVTVVSGKGGVGKSHVALYLAAAARSFGRRVLLVDADVGLASQDALLRVHPRHHLGHVVRGEVSLDDALVAAPGGFSLLASPVAEVHHTHMGAAERLNLLDALDAIAHRFDLVLVDTGAGLAGDALPLAVAAHEVVVVTTPEPPALRDAYAVVKLLCHRYGAHRSSLVVNGVRDAVEGSWVHRRLSAVAGRFLPVALEYLGCLPQDPRVPLAVRRGEPLYLTAPRSPFAAAARGLAVRLLERPAPGDATAARPAFPRPLSGGPEQ